MIETYGCGYCREEFGTPELIADHIKTCEKHPLAKAREALRHYATCSEGCTCGDGWDHRVALEALGEADPT